MLQSNKIRDAVRLFELIETAHSIEALRTLDREAGRIAKRQKILLQVNISADPRKAGLSPEAVHAIIADGTSPFEHLELRGLMTITESYDTAEEARPDFRALRELRDGLPGASPAFRAYDPRELSMGMSQDFEVAIEEGATWIRIGTDLFGPREAAWRPRPEAESP